MVPLQGGAAARGGTEDRLEVPPEALVERLRRRVAALERQLEARIAQVDDLRRRLAEQEPLIASARREAEATAAALRRCQAEYDALMSTKSMRALRVPRELYAAVRRLARSAGPGRPPPPTD